MRSRSMPWFRSARAEESARKKRAAAAAEGPAPAAWCSWCSDLFEADLPGRQVDDHADLERYARYPQRAFDRAMSLLILGPELAGPEAFDESD